MRVCLNVQASLRPDGTDSSVPEVHQCSREDDETDFQEQRSSSGSLAESELPDEAEDELAEMIIVAHTGKEQLKVNFYPLRNTQDRSYNCSCIFPLLSRMLGTFLPIHEIRRIIGTLAKENNCNCIYKCVYHFFLNCSNPNCVETMSNTLFSDAVVLKDSVECVCLCAAMLFHDTAIILKQNRERFSPNWVTSVHLNGLIRGHGYA